VGYVESAFARPLPSTCRGTAKIVEEKPDEVRVSTTMTTAGMLVLANRWDRGWTALIRPEADDQAVPKPVPIRQVNYAIEGVELPPGKWEVVFRHEPAGSALAARLGSLGLAIFLAASAWGFTRRPLERPLRA